MMSFTKYLITLAFVTVLLFPATAQQAEPFAEEIRAFKKQDSLTPPAKGAILFTGSSSIRLWKNLQQDFPGYRVLNRGFGGSSLPHVIRYANDIIIPYEPKQIFIYCGENDIASDSVDSKTVTERFKTLFRMLRQKLPGTPIVFISMKPSPSREKYSAVVEQANQMIKNFLYQQQNAGFVDVYSKMLDVAGKPRPELFGKDMLHMNEQGYAIWKEVVGPYLVKEKVATH